MKKFLFINFLLFLFPLFVSAQNLPQCDSLIIDCCDFGSDSLTITVSNPSSVLFDYPNFILFNTNMDTVAKETVTYFGIGQGGQPHNMIVLAPLILPFTGFLNLYTLFTDSLVCSFLFTIADTATSISDLQNGSSIKIFPNPSAENFTIQIKKKVSNGHFRVINVLGKIIREEKYADVNTIHLAIEKPGIYILELESAEGFIYRGKIIQQ